MDSKSSTVRFNTNLFPLGQFRLLEPGDKIEVGDLVMYEDGKINHQVSLPEISIYDSTMFPILRRREKS
jgi:hypothetical protein